MCKRNAPADKAVVRDNGRWIYEEFTDGLLRLGDEKIQCAASSLCGDERHILNTSETADSVSQSHRAGVASSVNTNIEVTSSYNVALTES